MPSDSHFAVALKTQKDAERAEQQRIKNLVLSYDPDSSTDQTGIAHDLSFDHFSQTNPNLSKQSSGFPFLAPLVPLEVNALAHNDTSQGLNGEKHGTSHHQHNASLHQTSSNNASTRPSDKSGTNRSGHRARKLQLSDVDWYEQKPGSSGSGRRGAPHRGPRRSNSRTAG